MSNNFFDLAIQFVDTAYGKKKVHFERTVYWMEKLYPNCSEAERIAAYAHDIERAFRDESKKVPENYLDMGFLRNHEEGGAKIIGNFLREKGAQETLISQVVHLISRHEEGGDDMQNILKDADSVSFFETNAENFVRKKSLVEGAEKVHQKLDWMYKRISSNVAREAARKNYEYWIGELEKVK